MDFSFSEHEEAFRREVQEFLATANPNTDAGDEGDIESAMDRLPKLMAWNQALYEKSWVGFSWPKEVGGGGGSLVEQMILKEECAKARAPMLGLSYMGLAWVGPGIIKYGTEEQKQRYIGPILRGEEHWCTGYSEPGSGSDLASLMCRADRDGDERRRREPERCGAFLRCIRRRALRRRRRLPASHRRFQLRRVINDESTS